MRVVHGRAEIRVLLPAVPGEVRWLGEDAAGEVDPADAYVESSRLGFRLRPAAMIRLHDSHPPARGLPGARCRPRPAPGHQPVQLHRPPRPAAVLPEDRRAVRPSTKPTEVGLLTSHVPGLLHRARPAVRLARRPHSRWQLIAVGVIVWSLASGGTGLATGVRHHAADALPDRRRRGGLRPGRPEPDLRPVPGRAARAACWPGSTWPSRSAAPWGSCSAGAIADRPRLAVGVLRRRAAGRAARGCCASDARAAPRRGRRRRRPHAPTAARHGRPGSTSRRYVLNTLA